MFTSVLVANRGEIAVRIIRTLRSMGIRPIAVHSDVDAESLHVQLADESHLIGSAASGATYQGIESIIEVLERTGAQAVHPGYGFLSENAEFAEAVTRSGAAWIGPSPDVIRLVGDKAAARDFMASFGVPVNQGLAVVSADDIAPHLDDAAFPLMVKPAAGGGGAGMRIVHDRDQLVAAVEASSAQAVRMFGDPSLVVERYLPSARHVEVQILGLVDGRVVVLGDRDCSVQRRFQKIVEEAPAPALDADVRSGLHEAARTGAEAIGYTNAGTFEFLVAGDEYVFLEVNARLQVEHPVTEATLGIDLVSEQLRIAAGMEPSFGMSPPEVDGHAIELRLYAEDPSSFFPRPGLITRWDVPPCIRVDSGFRAGDELTRHYDPLIAKVIGVGRDRRDAIAELSQAVDDIVCEGLTTNMPFLKQVLTSHEFRSAGYDTGIVDRIRTGTMDGETR